MEDARIGAALLLLFAYCWFYVVNIRDGKETCKSETIERTEYFDNSKSLWMSSMRVSGISELF